MVQKPYMSTFMVGWDFKSKEYLYGLETSDQPWMMQANQSSKEYLYGLETANATIQVYVNGTSTLSKEYLYGLETGILYQFDQYQCLRSTFMVQKLGIFQRLGKANGMSKEYLYGLETTNTKRHQTKTTSV